MKNILVIDDDSGILEALKLVLEFNGYRVYTLQKVENLMSNIETIAPDVILLDVLLSGSDGRVICKNLKKSDFKNIPIILISAQPDLKSTSKTSGAEDFLAKPFDINDLLDKVSKWTKNPSSPT